MSGEMKLKPCPFCGDERAYPLPATRGSKDRIYPVVRCMGCYTDVPGKNDDYSTKGKTAIEAWNRRAPSAAEAEVERLKAAREAWRADAAARLGVYCSLLKSGLIGTQSQVRATLIMPTVAMLEKCLEEDYRLTTCEGCGKAISGDEEYAPAGDVDLCKECAPEGSTAAYGHIDINAALDRARAALQPEKEKEL